MTDQKLTGYPSIDRPWLKYYSEDAINSKIPECSIYEYMHSNNQEYQDDYCIEYVGRKITYREMFENIEKAIKAFQTVGIKKGDIVAVIAPSLPEIIYSFYAVNGIGAVSDYFDPRTSAEAVKEEIISTNAKAVLIFEDFIERFGDALAGVDIIKISVSARTSLSPALKFLKGLSGRKNVPGFIEYTEFINNRNENCVEEMSGLNVADAPAIMEHTGGTTGTPKVVVLSNKNVNAVIIQYKKSDAPAKTGSRWLSVAFPFTAYSLICAQLTPLNRGITCVLCFSTDIKKIEKMLLSKRLSHMANTPLAWERILNSKHARKSDFSFLEFPIVGADTLDQTKEKEINKFLSEHGCNVTIKKGYGMTESAACVAMCSNDQNNRLGSVGLPFPDTNISIFKYNTDEELSYGVQGEVCISGPSVMAKYFNNEVETENVLKRHKDGLLWLHSGDLGHMDEDGFLYIDGRIKRMIINHMGFKIFAPDVEAVLMQHEAVDKCSVIGADDKEYGVGQNAVAFIIPRNNKAIYKDELKQFCIKRMDDYRVPIDFIEVSEFPYTAAAKVDYRALEESYVNYASN